MELVRCPCCSREMEKGEMRSRGGLYFLPNGEVSPMLYTKREMEKHNAIYLPTYTFDAMLDFKANFPTAYVCRSCSKIIIDFSNDERQAKNSNRSVIK